VRLQAASFAAFGCYWLLLVVIGKDKACCCFAAALYNLDQRGGGVQPCAI